MFQTNHCELFCEGLCGDGHVRAPRQMLVGGGASWITLVVIAPVPTAASLFAVCLSPCVIFWLWPIVTSQLSAMDVSVRSTMKGAAKCDKHCELQNSVNRQGLERILCFWDIPESMPASVSTLCCSSCCGSMWASYCDCSCLRMCAGTLEASD